MSRRQASIIEEAEEIGVSVMSVWEVSTKSAKGKLDLDRPLDDWLSSALANSKIRLLPVTYEVALESSRLPGPFHRDPADQMIVATARLLNVELVTSDARILEYPHVATIG